MAAVTVNLAGLNGNVGFGTNAAGGMDRENSRQVKNGSVFLGNRNNNNNVNSLIEQKRAQARKQAAKVLRDQFARDSKVTDGMDELRARNMEIEEELKSLYEQRKGFMEERDGLKEKYGIETDSQEQKDLDLIRRGSSLWKEGNLSALDKDELERLASLGERTEYQQRSLEYDKVIEHISSLEKELQNERTANTSTITGTKQAILESGGKGIRAARKAADSILQAASDAIIGMIWDAAKDHVDEEMEKLVEAAKEQAEKKEEEEEKLENIKEEKEEQKELTEDIQESTSEQTMLQDEIKKILKEAELLEEDMKGLAVDKLM